MATNKHAIIRYQTLDRCFGNPGRRYYIEDLIEACNQALYEYSGLDSGVKRRQVFEDIKFMESSQGWNIPLDRKKDGRRVYYRYEDTSFSINNQPLNENEVNQLKEALLTLARFKGMPQFEWVDELSARLESGLGLIQIDQKIIEFQQNQYLKGLEYITPIFEAIQYKKVLKILYKSFNSEEEILYNLHPYYLKQYNNRWFLFGKNEGYENISNIPLDRITKIEKSDIFYSPNTTIDFEEYFEDVIGVTVNEDDPILIQLKINSALYPYIKTKPLHGSQRYKGLTENGHLITLELIPNYELEAILLSFGQNIEVLEPEQFRAKIKERIDDMNKLYE
jgi:predicted DNA-binding transcriptional regulator YafY